MRNRITMLIVLISIILLSLATVKGIEIGDFKILSISKLIEKNDMLEEKIELASSLTSETYDENVDKLEETFNSYMVQKQKYNQLSSVTGEDDKETYETKQYDISYLWKVLGKYATNRGLVLGIDVKKGNSEKNIYNFNFTVTGPYVKISQFITDVENDSDLYFRIYNFKMNSAQSGVTATFTVKNINIDAATIK